MAIVAQLVRVSVCGTESRGFKSRQSPHVSNLGKLVTFIQSLLFGFIQGLSEFFPISSSAHLKLLKFFFHLNEKVDFHLFDLTCHLGTIVAAIIFLRKDIKDLFLSKRKDFLFICLAILPLFPVYFLMGSIRHYLSKDMFLGPFFIVTAFLLFIASKTNTKQIKISPTSKIKDVLFIGCMQTLALIPGISRSASTTTAARIKGWKLQDALKFSYLLAIPVIIGGSMLETLKEIMKGSLTKTNIPLSSYVGAFLVSLIVGLFAIKIIFSIKDAKKLRYFSWYLLIVGLATIIYINF